MFFKRLQIGLTVFPALIQQSKLGITGYIAFACLEFILEGFQNTLFSSFIFFRIKSYESREFFAISASPISLILILFSS